jgi:hypothetical protein
MLLYDAQMGLHRVLTSLEGKIEWEAAKWERQLWKLIRLDQQEIADVNLP